MNLGSIFDKSLFNEASYNAAIGDEVNNGYSVIKITPADKRLGAKNLDAAIKGITKDEFSSLPALNSTFI